MSLASIQKIIDLVPIPEADVIECAKILGWSVVVKKGEFKKGDLCIFIEIDSLVPRKEWSEFLFKHPEDTKHRLRTVKLRKQISQGLALPINILPQNKVWKEGDDVTEVIGVEKYEKNIPVNLRGQIRRYFPGFLRKTDEVRIQSAPELLDRLRGKPYYITQKLDGTSATFYRYKGEFGVCSRNVELKDPNSVQGFLKWLKREWNKAVGRIPKSIPPTNLYWKMAEKYNLKEIIPENYAVQGEICGPDIQENRIGLPECQLFIFNLFHITSQLYTTPFSKGWKNLPKFHYILEGLTFVPILEVGDEFSYSLEQLLEKAKGNYPNNTPQEGIVVRSLDQTISFKVVNNEFLLKYGE